MADEIDTAQRYEELDRSAAIARAVAVRHGDAFDGCCVDCGDEIPEARRRAAPAAERCVDCQSQAEGAR